MLSIDTNCSAPDELMAMTGMDKFTKIISVIRELIESKFTGYIKVNFTDGNIGRVEKYEEILKGKK